MPYCTHCGEANIADAIFCKLCGARVAVPIINVVAAAAAPAAAPVPVVTQALAATARLPLKSPGLAGLLSAVWPGCGQLYSGRAVGLAQMIFIPCGYAVLISLAFFSLALGEFLIAALLVLATLWAWMKVIGDAVDGAQQINAARTNARARVRAARGGGYALPAASIAPIASIANPRAAIPASTPAAIPAATGAVSISPREWPPLVFICVCAITLLVVILSSYA